MAEVLFVIAIIVVFIITMSYIALMGFFAYILFPAVSYVGDKIWRRLEGFLVDKFGQ